MTDSESEIAVIIAAQVIVAAFGLALDHHCRSGGGKEHCVTAAGMTSAQAAGLAAR